MLIQRTLSATINIEEYLQPVLTPQLGFPHIIENHRYSHYSGSLSHPTKYYQSENVKKRLNLTQKDHFPLFIANFFMCRAIQTHWNFILVHLNTHELFQLTCWPHIRICKAKKGSKWPKMTMNDYLWLF